MVSSNSDSDDEGGVEQVKHTLQLPFPLWAAFGECVRRIGISKSEGIRKAIWIYTYLAGIEDGLVEITVRRSDGREERLVISPY